MQLTKQKIHRKQEIHSPCTVFLQTVQFWKKHIYWGIFGAFWVQFIFYRYFITQLSGLGSISFLLEESGANSVGNETSNNHLGVSFFIRSLGIGFSVLHKVRLSSFLDFFPASLGQRKCWLSFHQKSKQVKMWHQSFVCHSEVFRNESRFTRL